MQLDGICQAQHCRAGRYLKNQLTIIVMENIAIIDNIAINEIEKMTIFSTTINIKACINLYIILLKTNQLQIKVI